MAKKPAQKSGSGPSSGKGAETIEGAAEEVGRKKKRTSPAEFFQQVIAEGRKVTWTSQKETLYSTIMVLIMVVIMAIFFFAVDSVLRAGVCTLLPIDCVSRDAL